MKIQNFCFVIPNSSWFGKRYWHNFPYTVGLLIAVIKRAGWNVSVIDANMDNLSEEQLSRALENMAPDVVALSAMTIEYQRTTHRTFKVIKDALPGAVTILGGVYSTLSPEVARKDANIDYIVCGEGEERIVKLLQAIEGGRIGLDKIDGLIYRDDDGVSHYAPPVSVVADLDSLPMPDYSLFDMKRYTNHGQKYTQNFNFRGYPWAQSITSRGCPFRCSFCASNNVYGTKIRYHSPERVLAEVDWLVKEYGIKEMIWVDDSYLQDSERCKTIFRGLIDRKYDMYWKSNNMSIFLMTDEILDMMAASGCYQVSISIESGHPRTLRRIRKPVNLDKIPPRIDKMKQLGMEIISNFVVGFPGETWEEIRTTFQYAEDIDIDYVLFSIATPLPRTPLYDECVAKKLIPDDFSFENFEYYGFGKGIITTDDFTPTELETLRAFEWDRINFKTEEKRAKICGMLGISLDELEVWRRETRRRLGVKVDVADAYIEG